MFWLVHIHNETNFNEHSFRLSLDFESRPQKYKGRTFHVMQWNGRNNQFIEKWKRSKSSVFFECQGHIFYLANEAISKYLGIPFTKGQFSLYEISKIDFIKAVHGHKIQNEN